MKKIEQALFHRIFETITRFQDLDSALRELLACLTECAGAQAGVLVRLSKNDKGQINPGSTYNHARDGKSGSELQSRFESSFFTDALKGKLASSARHSFLLSSFLGESAWRSSDVRLKIFQPQGAADAVVLLLRDPSRNTLWLACLTLKRRSDLQKDNLRLLESAIPQLCAGLENLVAWNERWKRAQAVETLLAYTNDLLVCISQSQLGEPRLVAATRAAQEVLGLRADVSPASERLREFMDLALSTRNATQNGPRWLSPNGQVYRLTRETAPEARGGGLSLIRLSPAMEVVQEPSRADDLRAAHNSGLSMRESAVFAHMARGLGNREIAEALSISIDTVRAHLRNVFAKLNVSSRVEAINAVRRGIDTSETFFAAPKSPIDMSAALNNDTTRSLKSASGLNATTEPTPHAIGITAQAT